jgi:hypothetical protein
MGRLGLYVIHLKHKIVVLNKHIYIVVTHIQKDTKYTNEDNSMKISV